MIEQVVERWEAQLRGGSRGGLDELLADEVVFYSPVVYTPQRGRTLTALYLEAARQTFPGDRAATGSSDATGSVPGPPGPPGKSEVPGSFHYTKRVLSGDTAVLEFETTMGGTYVNGVDIIRADASGRIIEFRVMIRPLQAIQAVHAAMGAILERLEVDG